MKSKADHFEDLKQTGLKNTKHRCAILELLEQQTQPVTVEQVFLLLNRSAVPASLSTVYRELDNLTDHHLAVKIRIGESGKTLYEYNRWVHKHYLICLGCKKMISVGVCPLEEYEKKLGEQTNFLITGHRLSLYGYCPECRAKGLSGKHRSR